MVIESVTPVKNAIVKSKKSVSFAIDKNETHELEHESQSVDVSDGKQLITYDRDFLLKCSKSQVCKEYPQDWDKILQKFSKLDRKANMNNNETTPKGSFTNYVDQNLPLSYPLYPSSG